MESVQAEVVNLNSKSVFSLNEVNELLNVVNKITDKYQAKLTDILDSVERETNSNSKEELKALAQVHIDQWNAKVKKLGARPSGIWFADFDFGEGYYCWKYPETKISHWHKYSEGFSKRKLIPTYQ